MVSTPNMPQPTPLCLFILTSLHFAVASLSLSRRSEKTGNSLSPDCAFHPGGRAYEVGKWREPASPPPPLPWSLKQASGVEGIKVRSGEECDTEVPCRSDSAVVSFLT